MRLLSWFSRTRIKQDEDEVMQKTDKPKSADLNEIPPKVSGDFTFDEIADQLEFYHREYFRQLEICEQANQTILACQKEIKQLRDEVAPKPNKPNRGQRGARHQGRPEPPRRRESADKTEARRKDRIVESLQTQVGQQTAAYNEMIVQNLDLSEKLVDMRFELEVMRCTSSGLSKDKSNSDPEAPIIPQPFVAVLIDGDAYAWSPELFQQIHTPSLASTSGENTTTSAPGAIGAMRLKNEVNKYLLQHPEIPGSCKIVARAFINLSSGQRVTKQIHIAKRQNGIMIDFARHFTQAIPLFDFFDAGIGKERVDEKIRENFHLYISNPHCHAVFLATCTDNGFARMLEPYQRPAAAYQKIILVSPGYVEREIEQLGFQQVVWPSVFARMQKVVRPPKSKSDPAASRKTRRGGKNQAPKRVAGEEKEDVSSERASEGLSNDYVAALILDTVAPWDVNAAMYKYSRGLGFRMPKLGSASKDVEIVLEGPSGVAFPGIDGSDDDDVHETDESDNTDVD